MKIINIILIIMIVMITILSGYLYFKLQETKNNYNILNNETEVYKISLQSLLSHSESSISSQKANLYYDLASSSYENREYQDCISNCETARVYFMETVTNLESIQSKLKDFPIQHGLIEIQEKMYYYIISMNYNMFEACEYFESACSSYSKNDYLRGGESIKSMNEKIRSHDSDVKYYNSYLEDFRLKLSKRLS